MSTSSYLSYQPPAFLPSQDSTEYGMAMALDIKPMSSYLSDPYLLEDFQRRLMQQSLAHPVHEPQASFPYQHLSAPQHPASSISIYDIRRTHELRQPAPVRPVSTTQLYSSANEMDATRHSYETQVTPYTSAPISDPSPMVVESRIRTPVEPMQPPPPAPSWAMSGSLDPTTGIYQSAPEHPRVRTAQACNKCRSRKAKCSGEHPTCERCRVRGLRCEYAPERKMRGPNKVKRVQAKKDTKESRRTSIASSSSSTSARATSRSRSPKPPFTTVPRRLGSASSTSSSDMPPPPPVDGQKSSSDTPRAGKPRPTHIDLSSLGGTTMQFSLGQPAEASAHSDAHRRASLPSHLLEAYTSRQMADQAVYSPPRGIEVLDAHARPHSNPMFHQPVESPMGDAFTGWPPMPSNASDTSSSPNPVTPLSLYEGELMYPLEYTNGPDVAHNDVDFSAFEHAYVENNFLGHHQDWSTSSFDTTPTGYEVDHEKHYQ